MKVKLVPIGNSEGARIPQAFINACGFEEHVEMRIERNASVLAAPRGSREVWEAAFGKMAAVGDDELLLPDDRGSGWDDAQREW